MEESNQDVSPGSCKPLTGTKPYNTRSIQVAICLGSVTPLAVTWAYYLVINALRS